MLKYILPSLIFTNSLYAIVCEDLGEFKQSGSQYYTVTKTVLEFNAAKKIAEKSNGYLSIPNNAAENNFLKTLISNDEYAWIGVYDSSMATNYCYDISKCIPSPFRYKDIKNNPLVYSNWYTQEPNNLVKQHDTIEGKQMVSPLGEHWGAIHGATGKWSDVGNHIDELNYPIKFKAIFEFDTKPVCVEPKEDFTDELKNKKCNPQIWDSHAGTINPSTTLDCQKDVHGNDYCPSALADASKFWDYENGYSSEGLGSTIDYTEKIKTESITPMGWKNVKTYTNVHLYGRVTKPDGVYYNGSGVIVVRFGKKRTRVRYELRGSGRLQPNPDMGRGSSKIHSYNNSNVKLEFRVRGGNNRGQVQFDFVKFYEKASCAGTIKGGQCVVIRNECPAGYSETIGEEVSKGECKRTKEYTYYEYKCKTEPNEQGYDFKPVIPGGDCNKEDTDKNNVNEDLSDACNKQTPPENNCRREIFLCQYNDKRPPVWIDNKWQCSPFPCIGPDDIEDLDTKVGENDKKDDGWEDNGSCTGQIYIFNGNDNRCRSWDMLFGLMGGGCCDKDKVFLGLIKCKEEEKNLAKLQKAKITHYVGEYCSKKIPLVGACIQKKKSYCAFSSILARSIHEEGRPQIGLEWGKGKSPECRGFTPEEFQKLDFSKIDLSEFTNAIVEKAKNNMVNSIENAVDGIKQSYE